MSKTLISSSSNVLYKHLKQLFVSKKHRHKSREFLIESQKGVESLLNYHQFKCQSLFIKEDSGLNPLTFHPHLTVHTLTKSLFESLTHTPNSQVIGQFCMSEPIRSLNPNWRRLFFLDTLQDPGNLGAILRVAVAFGIDAVVLSKYCVDVFHPKVWRGCVGLSAQLPFISEESMSIESIKKAGFKCVGLEAKSNKSIRDLSYQKCMIVLGSEGQGISQVTKKECDDFFAIPIQEEIDSLNVAVSAGIVAYHLSGMDFN